MERKRYIVGPDTVRMLELGHPWVIADRYTRRWPKGQIGDLITLEDDKGRALATALLEPDERVVARVLAPGRVRLDLRWLTERLEAALDLRRDHVDLEGTSAYRVVNAEGDGLPGLTVDLYGEHLMVQLYSRAWKPYKGLLLQALQQLLAPQGIYEKFRPRQTRKLEADSDDKHYSRLLAGAAAPGRSVVQENGLDFLVELEQGLNTGLFLDQRANRRDLMARVKGRSFLNLFAYTGAFSVAAAAAGASKVTSVDVSSTYLDWAKENFSANRLNPRRHEFLAGDCLAVLKDLERQGRRYDVILMDPPSFSTTKKGRFATKGGTSDLIAAALPLLEPGGLMISSSNHQKVDVADYLKELRRGTLQAGSELRVVRLAGQAADFPYPVTFPEGRYLKYAMAVKGLR